MLSWASRSSLTIHNYCGHQRRVFVVTQLPVDGFNDNERENHIWSGGKHHCYDSVHCWTLYNLNIFRNLRIVDGFWVKAICWDCTLMCFNPQWFQCFIVSHWENLSNAHWKSWFDFAPFHETSSRTTWRQLKVQNKITQALSFMSIDAFFPESIGLLRNHCL